MKDNPDDALFDVIAYLVGSARTVLDETQRSGALRMLRAVQLLIRLRTARENASDKRQRFLLEVDEFIDMNRDVYLTGDQKGLENFLDDLARKFAAEFQRG